MCPCLSVYLSITHTHTHKNNSQNIKMKIKTNTNPIRQKKWWNKTKWNKSSQNKTPLNLFCVDKLLLGMGPAWSPVGRPGFLYSVVESFLVRDGTLGPWVYFPISGLEPHLIWAREIEYDHSLLIMKSELLHLHKGPLLGVWIDASELARGLRGGRGCQRCHRSLLLWLS